MKRIFLLAAILLSTQAQAARLQCDIDQGRTANAGRPDETETPQMGHGFLVLDINDERVLIENGQSGYLAPDDALPIQRSTEAGIAAWLVDGDYEHSLELSRTSLKLTLTWSLAGFTKKSPRTDIYYKGQCYESDPKF